MYSYLLLYTLWKYPHLLEHGITVISYMNSLRRYLLQQSSCPEYRKEELEKGWDFCDEF